MNIILGIVVFAIAIGFVGCAFIASGQQYDKHIAEEVKVRKHFAYKPKGIITLYSIAIVLAVAGIIFLNVKF